MIRDLPGMAQGERDLLVIGAGILGTAIARDAALRGLDVALVEKEDFGYGTSSRSTRLAHGGLRYLERFELGLVREALLERERLVRNAAHLVVPIRFLLPAYDSAFWLWKLRAGLWLYDSLGGGSLPRSEILSREKALAIEPALSPNGLRGAGSYYDARVTSVERLCLENAIDAERAGCRIATHARVASFLREGEKVVGAHVLDTLGAMSHEIRARLTINASGPWVPSLAELAGTRVAARRSRGSHLVLPNFLRTAVLLRARSDGRYFFAVPQNGQALIGTTELPDERSPDDAQCSPSEARYLLDETRRHLQVDASPLYSTCGVRLLVDEPGKPEGELSRRHEIRDHAEDGAPRLWSVMGGKITTMRLVAEDVVDHACEFLGRKRWCETRERPLPGAVRLEEARKAIAARAASAPELGAVSDHFLSRYGARAGALLDLAAKEASLLRPLCPHTSTLAAEIVFAAREEGALTLSDAMLRRTPAANESCQGEDAAPLAAALLANELHWTASRTNTEIEALRRFTLGRISFFAAPG